jgi:hypothetical protein
LRSNGLSGSVAVVLIDAEWAADDLNAWWLGILATGLSKEASQRVADEYNLGEAMLKAHAAHEGVDW